MTFQTIALRPLFPVIRWRQSADQLNEIEIFAGILTNGRTMMIRGGGGDDKDADLVPALAPLPFSSSSSGHCASFSLLRIFSEFFEINGKQHVAFGK